MTDYNLDEILPNEELEKIPSFKEEACSDLINKLNSLAPDSDFEMIKELAEDYASDPTILDLFNELIYEVGKVSRDGEVVNDYLEEVSNFDSNSPQKKLSYASDLKDSIVQ